MEQDRIPCATGIDVGGTKCAAGVVALQDGNVIERCVQPTEPRRGGEAVLQTVIELTQLMLKAARDRGLTPESVGLGVAELVDVSGDVVSNATIDWRGIDVTARIAAATGLPTRIDADVRAAARAEARFGAGRGLDHFLYVTVGTGISCALVVNGSPYVGFRGLTGTFASEPGMVPDVAGSLIASQPLESYAAGPALVARMKAIRPKFEGTTNDVLALAEAGDKASVAIVESAGRALGAAIAHLINVLDPAAVVLGGGLGLAGGLYLKSMDEAVRQFRYAEGQQDLLLLPARLGVDAGWIGAAFTPG